VLDGVVEPDFPVQVRHGSPRPADIVRALVRAGLSATEGGPVSYCLPYSRTPLDESVRNWERGCALLLEAGPDAHMETFGGCMMGQLCPPSLLVALSALEAVFFHQRGLRSISVSYAQQTHLGQDQEAVLALRELCGRLLPDTRWHVVVYAYMGLYPRTGEGSRRLLARAVELAVTAGAARLIVKTEAEAHRIPTVAENVAALEHAAAAARLSYPDAVFRPGAVYLEAAAIVEAVLGLDGDVGRALVTAFKAGLLDVPYCLHPDNANRSRSAIAPDGRLAWSELGALPLRGVAETQAGEAITSSTLLSSLSFVQKKFDLPLLEYTVKSLDRGGAE
jgi:methylaspartate mutase epsilon subunit